ncbi:MAG: arginine repressor [Clostridia bacterium]|nr:arginine repressor [Clostridia bacterium]
MKFQRQAAILRIISENEIKTQEELSALVCKAGFPATQATISRDIKELKLVKVSTVDNGYKYAAPNKHGSATYMSRLKNIFKECVIRIDRAQNLVVVKTLTGMANAAAAAMDAMEIETIVGTIAGDDTILIILHTNDEAEKFCITAGDLLK